MIHFKKGFLGNSNYEPTKGSIYRAALESARIEYPGAEIELGSDRSGNFMLRIIRPGHEDIFWAEGGELNARRQPRVNFVYAAKAAADGKIYRLTCCECGLKIPDGPAARARGNDSVAYWCEKCRGVYHS